jgi:hypothetical protein
MVEVLGLMAEAQRSDLEVEVGCEQAMRWLQRVEDRTIGKPKPVELRALGRSAALDIDFLKTGGNITKNIGNPSASRVAKLAGKIGGFCHNVWRCHHIGGFGQNRLQETEILF